MNGYKVARSYRNGLTRGWAGKYLAEAQFDLIGDDFVSFALKATKSKEFLWKFTRALLGKDTPNYAQEAGSCVGFGAKNATEYLSAYEIIRLSQSEKWRPVYVPYYYGTGRVFIGRNRFQDQDGSLGSWMARAVVKYGTLFADWEGVPPYSGRMDKLWGKSADTLQKWAPIAKDFSIKSAARIRSWDEMVAAVTNGYPIHISSNRGFEMKSKNGFHIPKGSWAHAMSIIGVDNSHSKPYGIILNSWGDVHGRLRNFETEELLPVGVLRVDAEVIEKDMIKGGEAYAFSQFEGFPTQDIDKSLFDLIGQ